MKKTDLAKNDAKKLMGKLATPGAPVFGKTPPVVIDKREQRKRDQALGLVPFAIKLNSDLVLQLQTAAREQEKDISTLVGELLSSALAK